MLSLLSEDPLAEPGLFKIELPKARGELFAAGCGIDKAEGGLSLDIVL